MKNIRSLNTSPEGLQPVSALVEQLQENQRKSAELLELRTEAGPIYLRPTGWQRFCLQRAFRHFRVLPPQLLGSRNQRRIAALLETAEVKPEGPVSSGEIFGVVAQVHAKSPVEVSHVEKVSPAPAKTLALVTQKKEAPVPPKPTLTPVKPAGFVQDDGLWQWVVAGVAAAACIPLIMASVYGISALSSTPQVSSQAIPAAAQQAVVQVPLASPAVVAPAVLPIPEKHRRRLPADAALPALAETSTTPARATAAPERFVSTLPPGHFAHPDTTGSLAGEVRLKATIGADGSVKQVTVLSGDPRLAQAAMRAVMRWHYSPYGDPVAAETEIKMKFFGTDGVSIASVAGPAS